MDAELFILRNQRARRNLPTYTLAEIAFEIEKRKESGRGNNQYTKESGSLTYVSEANRDREEEPFNKAAKSAGMSHDTYAKCKYIDKHGTDGTAKYYGCSSLSPAHTHTADFK